MKKYLITGGVKGTAINLAKFLFEEGHYVRIADCNPKPLVQTEFCSEYCVTDLKRKGNCETVTEDIDYVFHLANTKTHYLLSKQQHATVLLNNALVDCNLLEASKQNNVQSFLYTSTPKLSSLEQTIPYYVEQLFMEQLCKSYYIDYGFETRIVRLGNVYGPHFPYSGGKEGLPEYLCNTVSLAEDNSTINLWSYTNFKDSYCYVDDVIDGLMKVMHSNVRDSIELGSTDQVTVLELTNKIVKASKKKLSVIQDLAKLIPVSVPLTVKHSKQLLVDLNWKPKVSLNKGLQLTYEWVNSQVNKD